MAKHVKPTQEELDQKIQDDLKKLDTPDPVPTPAPTPDPPAPDLEPIPIPDPEPTPDPVPTPAPTPDTVPDPNPSPAPTPSLSPDAKEYKHRYKESSNEAVVLFQRNKAMNEAIIKAKTMPEPTDEELAQVNPDWDLMTDFERKTAKNNFINDRRWSLIDEATKPFVDMEKWAEEVSAFVEDPKTTKAHPELNGKEEAFIEYATRVTKSGVPFDVLIPAFLHSESLKKVPNKGQMLPTGTHGPNAPYKPPSTKLTIEQGRELMNRDYNAYKAKLMAGEIEEAPIE